MTKDRPLAERMRNHDYSEMYGMAAAPAGSAILAPMRSSVA